MTIAELMAAKVPDAGYEGFTTNDDMVLAVDIAAGGASAESAYVVVQTGVAGLDAQMNPVTSDKQYVRAGKSTTKTGTQRTFKVTGDRYNGDAFQDFALSHAIRFGNGSAVEVPYIYFNMLTGIGEKGKVAIIVNSDGGGNSGESAGIDIDLKKVGAQPTEYTYVAA